MLNAVQIMCPFGVRVLQQTTSSIRLAWSEVTDTRVYKVTELKVSKSKPQPAAYWGTTPQCQIAGLDSNFCYTFQVHAMRVDDTTGSYFAHQSSQPLAINTLAPAPTSLSLHRAIRNAHEYTLKRILSVRPELLAVPGPNGLLPLHSAVLAGSKDLMDIMLRFGADVNAACPLSGRTALQLALFAGHVGIAKTLTERRADLGAVDCVGACAAVYAVDGGHEVALQLMMELHANTLRVKGGGVSVDALLRRAIVMRSEESVVRTLLDHAKMVNLPVDWHEAFRLATESGQNGLAEVVRSRQPEELDRHNEQSAGQAS